MHLNMFLISIRTKKCVIKQLKEGNMHKYDPDQDKTQ